MNKHYVVLAFTPEQEGDVKGIPWHDLLKGAVNVVDYQYVTPPMSEHDAMIKGMNDCINSHDYENDEQALEEIQKAAMDNKPIPNEITIWASLDRIDDASELLEHIESFANGYVGRYAPKEPIQRKSFQDAMLDVVNLVLEHHSYADSQAALNAIIVAAIADTDVPKGIVIKECYSSEITTARALRSKIFADAGLI